MTANHVGISAATCPGLQMLKLLDRHSITQLQFYLEVNLVFHLSGNCSLDLLKETHILDTCNLILPYEELICIPVDCHIVELGEVYGVD